MVLNRGVQLWQRAKKIIPGGNQLLSKRSEKYLPGLWPSYYRKAKGCEIWDLDGNHYYDFAQMGVGSCVLGYADNDINAAVIQAIQDGSMSTLNCYEEVDLAEELIHMHQWAEMVRFGRTGGEACAIAVRIARAATGRSKVAFCGYHGWHDWYISSNIGDSSNLDGQLLPGLQPRGVPRELHETTIPFNYNQLNELEDIVTKHGRDIGVIIMEPARSSDPVPGFLEGVRKIADKIGAVLIFDEVTSGFRVNMGGIHLNFGVEPDIAVFGKALGNGFPIAAIIGRRSVMDCAQESFISSTFWTERTGFVAALATIKKMREKNVPQHLIHYGENINVGWLRIAKEQGVDIRINGIAPLTHISFANSDPLATQTLYTQEMLGKGFLVGAAVYASYAYSDDVIDRFITASHEVFGTIRKALDTGSLRSLLKGDVVHSGFKRLT